LEPTPEGVKVTWTFQGDAGKNPIGRYMGLMIESFLGPQYERGLANIKKIAESLPVPMPEPMAPEGTSSGDDVSPPSS
jgi:hypothetical protein